jgi:hypothetical protein
MMAVIAMSSIDLKNVAHVLAKVPQKAIGRLAIIAVASA